MTRAMTAAVAMLIVSVAAIAGAQAQGGNYNVAGRVNGTSEVAEGGGAGSMTTAEYGMDVFVWDSVNAEYKVYDGATSLLVAEFVLTVPQGPPPPTYFVQYYKPAGTPDGHGTWDQTS